MSAGTFLPLSSLQVGLADDDLCIPANHRNDATDTFFRQPFVRPLTKTILLSLSPFSDGLELSIGNRSGIPLELCVASNSEGVQPLSNGWVAGA